MFQNFGIHIRNLGHGVSSFRHVKRRQNDKEGGEKEKEEEKTGKGGGGLKWFEYSDARCITLFLLCHITDV